MVIPLEQKLNEAGYKLLGNDESIESLILNILKTKNNRYLKAIPFLIYKYKPNTLKIYTNSLIDKTDKLFNLIINITAKIFFEFNIQGILIDYIERQNKEEFEFGTENIMKSNLDYDEFKTEFELQLRNENKSSLFIDKQKIYLERDLQMALSQIFTKKEKQIMNRLLEDKPISQTDYEYYSRKTKKKLNAILTLQDFAKSIHLKTPIRDENLFILKKLLEEWMELNNYGKKINLQKFFIWDNDAQISISYVKNEETQTFNTLLKLKEIKNVKLLNLINKYRQHEFE